MHSLTLLADATTPPQFTSPEQLLTLIVVGIVLGATGQGVRAIVGWKQLHDKAAATGVSIEDLFQIKTLLMSFGIGAVAGVCATLGLVASKTQWDMRSVLGIMAAGYAGADFIEGFASQYLPTPNAANANNSDGAASPASKDDPNEDAAKSEGLASDKKG
jgi:hypothetical protein